MGFPIGGSLLSELQIHPRKIPRLGGAKSVGMNFQSRWVFHFAVAKFGIPPAVARGKISALARTAFFRPIQAIPLINDGVGWSHNEVDMYDPFPLY